MKCRRCGKNFKLTRAIRSIVRREDYEYQCKCGYVNKITEDDVDANNEMKFYRLSEQRGKHG